MPVHENLHKERANSMLLTHENRLSQRAASKNIPKKSKAPRFLGAPSKQKESEAGSSAFLSRLPCWQT